MCPNTFEKWYWVTVEQNEEESLAERGRMAQHIDKRKDDGDVKVVLQRWDSVLLLAASNVDAQTPSHRYR
ncbi:hypothetical protein CVT26_012979 [Gymnopilus dilepis]|uniref:Uncharacterized protein n=1 Tax=Gymnopilus dilepis TaxID=231916 RepID=A0A409YP60_9AGAR|nr:hypothetical protein CVT26_012979 [Gymnopilus dilepis]